MMRSMAPPPADPSPDLHPGNRTLTRACLVAMVLGCYFSVAAMHILLGLAFVSWVSSSMPALRHPLRTPLMWPMGGFVLIAASSAMLAWNPTSTKEAFSFATPLLVYVMTRDVMAGPSLVNRSVQYVIWGGVLAAGLGLAQSAFEAQGFWISGNLSRYGTFSGVLLLALMLNLSRVLFGANARERIPLLLGLGIILWALVMMETSGVWVGLVAGCATLIGLWRPRALVALPIVLIGAYFSAPSSFQENIQSTLNGSDPIVHERLSELDIGIEIILDNPLLGVGPRRVPEVYGDYRAPEEAALESRIPRYLHNNAIQIGADLGLLGLGFWLAIWISWFLRVARSYACVEESDRASRAVIAGCLASMAGFQVMGLFEYNMGDSEVAFLTLFVFALPLAIEAYSGD
jgi:O-antigen ligase